MTVTLLTGCWRIPGEDGVEWLAHRRDPCLPTPVQTLLSFWVTTWGCLVQVSAMDGNLFSAVCSIDQYSGR